MEESQVVPGMIDVLTMEKMFQEHRQNKRQSERMGYYRRPGSWSQPLWIVTAETQPQIRFDKMGHGFEPLPHYGFTPPATTAQGATKAADFYGCSPDNSRELWTPILTHPKGPSEFPGEQVMYFRWYRPEGLPGVMRNKKLRFAQFESMARERGGIKEYRCPDCTGVSFFRPSHMARHLHNSHGYDQAAIIALGQASGIDFNEGLMSLVEAEVLWEVPEQDYEQEMSTTPPPVDSGVTVVESLVLPNQEQMRRAQEQVQQVHESPAMMAMIADLRQQIEDLKAGTAESAKVKPVRDKPLTEAQLAHLERMRAARAEKAKAVEEPEPALV